MTLVTASLQTPATSSELRNKIVETFWGPKALPGRFYNGEKDTNLSLDAYFGYYDNQCRLIALYDDGNYASVGSHQDIIDIVRDLRNNLKRDDIRRRLARNSVNESEADQIDASINLALRALLMIEFGSLPHAFSGHIQPDWREGTLREFLYNYFSQAPILSHEGVKLPPDFTARNLSRLAGVEVVWTDNLADHLRVTDGDKKVAVFHHALFLEYQSQSLLPHGLVEETLRSLALLFPQVEDTERWFREMSSTQSLDNRVIRCGLLRTDDRQIEKFKFWRDRIIILKQVFDEAKPSTLLQWWYDRRNGKQWYTFWIAVLVLILTFFFGFVQSIEGALQAYKAFHPS